MPPAARVTDMHTCPKVEPGPVPHVGGPTSSGEPTVIIGGMRAARVGDSLICFGGPPDSIAQGEATVIITGRQAARLGDGTSHGGMIVAGCPTVIIGSTAQAQTLFVAANDGTPFCEECARKAAEREAARLKDSADSAPAEGEEAAQSNPDTPAQPSPFSLKVPYKSGERVLTLDGAGGLVLDGKPLALSKYKEVYKQLGLAHAYNGHGPHKDVLDIASEARHNSPSFASGKFSSHKALLESFVAAKAELEAGRAEGLPIGGKQVHLPATSEMGRAFVRADKLTQGSSALGSRPLDNVVEVSVTRIRAIFNPDDSIKSIYPIGDIQ